MIDLSLVVNLHREGNICRPTLSSVSSAVTQARAFGIDTEVILILDKSDLATRAAVGAAKMSALIYEISVGDLGDARNYAATIASGEYVAFLDGDDICCRNWIVRAILEARNYGKECIVHPKFNLFFGRDYDRYVWVHPDVRFEDFTLARLLVENLWTSPIVARRTTFTKFPYRANRLEAGFGYEDWLFNVETTVAGIAHITAPETILFIRRNKSNSLLERSASLSVISDLRHIDILRRLSSEKLRDSIKY